MRSQSRGGVGAWKEVEDTFTCVPGHYQDIQEKRKQVGTLAIEGTWRCCLATWQSLLVPEPGNPCLEVPSVHEAGPPFLQTQRVAGALGWLGCGH